MVSYKESKKSYERIMEATREHGTALIKALEMACEEEINLDADVGGHAAGMALSTILTTVTKVAKGHSTQVSLLEHVRDHL